MDILCKTDMVSFRHWKGSWLVGGEPSSFQQILSNHPSLPVVIPNVRIAVFQDPLSQLKNGKKNWKSLED